MDIAVSINMFGEMEDANGMLVEHVNPLLVLSSHKQLRSIHLIIIVVLKELTGTKNTKDA